MASAEPVALSTRQRIIATAGYSMSMIGLGMVMTLHGPTLPGLTARLGLESEASLSPLLTAHGLGYMLGTLGYGWLLDHYHAHAHRLVLAAMVTMGAGAALVPLAGSLPLVWLCALVQSIGGGGADIALNIAQVEVWTGANGVQVEGSASAMNALHAFWGIGSTAAPLAAAAIGLEAEELPTTFAVCAVLAVLSGLPVLYLPSLAARPAAAAPPAVEADGVGPASGEDGGKRVVFVAMFLYFFCYLAVEKGGGDWMATYSIAATGAAKAEGAFATSALWGSLMVMRFLSIPIAACVSLPRFLAALFALSVVSCLALALFGGTSYGTLIICVVGIGAGLSSMYPMGILFAKTRVDFSGSEISRFVVGGTISAMVTPALLGLTMSGDAAGFSWALTVFMVLMAVSFAVVLLQPPLAPPHQDATEVAEAKP